ncbi:NADase-type glycan-binding domain-containing protein [Desulfovibrio gilichinskyi]|uniref:NAD glycohydrolase translocation F5/8 type C domain-containing protein n=1 Tax=Desulfovibrio gilichinskyi TaxID=1519643 RepID=A0A1X7DLX3_9BACT|nr:hypothetical protein [Desulfovibrio gilichinskyi]SMF17932.1 hypothetical protein SAMN06295933_2061 [Desulfovibrio gilichinskyi]
MFRKLFFILLIIFAFPVICSANPVNIKALPFTAQIDETAFNVSILMDNDTATGWIFNTDGKKATQILQFSFPQGVVVDTIAFINGVNLKNIKVSKVKDIQVSFGGVHRQSATLKNISKRQVIKAVECITESLEIEAKSVYSDGKSDQAGISEIQIKYHIPNAKEKSSLIISRKELVKEPKLTAEQEKILAEKIEKLNQERLLLREMKNFFDKFYSAFVTISEEYPRMFVEEEFIRESSYFESFRSMLEKRGVLEKYQKAIVSTSGLRFNIRTHTADEVELWVKGSYSVIIDLKDNQVTENSLYILKKEYGEWKVKSKIEY